MTFQFTILKLQLGFLIKQKINSVGAELPAMHFFQTTKSLSFVAASETEILNLMQSLYPSKSCGCDDIGNRIIKLYSAGIYQSFTKMINISFSLGQYPKQCRRANVVPLFKKGDRQLQINYRTVSLLPNLSKIAEKIVFSRVYNFLMDIGYLHIYQAGFGPGQSTTAQLTYMVHLIYEALECGKEVRAVFLDISKAFDKVWHEGLMWKLEYLGIRGRLLQWFASYLEDREKRVVIKGVCSSWEKNRSWSSPGLCYFYYILMT